MAIRARDLACAVVLAVEQVPVLPGIYRLERERFTVRFPLCLLELKILDIARRRGLKIIEDCSHAHGAKWKDKGLGTIGDVGAFSLGAGKNLTAGEGGIVLTDDDAIYWSSVDYHDLWSGSIRERLGIFRYLSWNYRMSEIQGALLNANLDVLESQSTHRSANGDYL